MIEIPSTFGDDVAVAFLFVVAIGIGLAGASSLLMIWRIVSSMVREIRAERRRRWWT